MTVLSDRVIRFGEASINEEKVFGYLDEHLPREYKILTNLSLENNGDEREYDAIILGQYAIYILEIKNFGGVIRGDAINWEVVKNKYIPPGNPLLQLKTQTAILVTKLKEVHARALVQGYVCLSGEERPELQIRESPGKLKKVRWYKGIEKFLTDKEELVYPPTWNLEDILPKHDMLVKSFRTGFSARVLPRRIGEYSIDEAAWHTRRYKAYFAHRDEKFPDRNLLKVYKIPDSVPEEDIYKFTDQLDRDLSALKKIQKTGNRETGGAENVIIGDKAFPMKGQREYVVVMEWVDGKPLSNLMREGQAFSFEEKCSIAGQICCGLAFAHSADILHRNLSPDNIIWSPGEGCIKIINFDFAKFIDNSLPSFRATGDLLAEIMTELQEKAKYQAPELHDPSNQGASGAQPGRFPYPNTSKESDIYALGVILLELFTNTVFDPNEKIDISRLDEPALSLNAQIIEFIKAFCSTNPENRKTVSLVQAADVFDGLARGKTIDSSFPSLKTGDRLGRYEILKQFDTLSMNIVYLARDTMENSKVVIKFLRAPSDDESRGEIKRAEEILKEIGGECTPRLISKNIVFVARGKISEEKDPAAREVIYQVWEYIEGLNLKEYLQSSPPDAQTALNLTLEIIKSVSLLHEKGWIHQDIKPANFIVTPAGKVKIIDFGLSKRITDPLTPKGGSPGYIPPESIVTLDGKVTQNWTLASDVWATARVIISLLCGEDNSEANGPIVDWNTIEQKAGAEIVTLLKRDTNKTPANRHATATEMLVDYKKVIGKIAGRNGKSMEYQSIVSKLLEKAEKQEKDFGDTAAANELNNCAKALQAWIDKGQNGECPVELAKYDLSPALVVDQAETIPAVPVKQETQPALEEEVKPEARVTEEPETVLEISEPEPIAQQTTSDEAVDLAALAGEMESPDQLNLRKQLEEARQYYKNGQLRESLALSKVIESHATGSTLKEAARDLLDQAGRQLKTALKKALADGDAARLAEQLDEAGKFYKLAQELDPENEHAKAALLDLRGSLKDQLSETRITALRSGLKERRDSRRLGDSVYEAEALDGEGKLTRELVKLLEDGRKFYDKTRKDQGEETTQMRFGDLSARSDAVAKIRGRVAVGEKSIFDSTTNTERPGFELLREANELLEQASADAAQYELDLVDKQKSTHPRYAAQRLEIALTQPFSEKYIRLLNEKKAEVESLVRVQERTEKLLDQVQKEDDPVKVYGLVLQAQKTFAYIPGLPEQVIQARQLALNALVVEVTKCHRDARVALDAALSSGDYKPAREKITRAEKLAATWPEESMPGELKRAIEDAAGVGQKIDKIENDWNEYNKYAKSIRVQVVDSGQRAAALDLFRNIRTEDRFKAFPDLRILASEIDNYTDVGEKLNEAQAAYAVGEWSRVFELADKVIKSGKAGQLAEKFNTLFETATVELSVGRARTLLEQDDVFEANNVLSAVLNREKGTAREAELRQRLEEELARISQCIKNNPPMQAQYDRASELIGLRDSALLKAYVNPAYALRQAQGKDSTGKESNPEMRSLVNTFKKDPGGPEPSAEELSMQAGAALVIELSRKYSESASERLSALRLFRYVGGDLGKASEPEKSNWRLSLRAAEARRAGRLLVESIRKDVLPALTKAYANRKDKIDSSAVPRRLAENARGLREAELLETDDEKDAGRWLEVEWGRQQAGAQEEHGDWGDSVRIWLELKSVYNTEEIRKNWRRVRIQQAVELAHDLIVNDHKGEDALQTLEAVKSEPGIGNSWEVEQAIADAYTLLGNFDSAFGSLDEALRFAPQESDIMASLLKKQKEMAREKEIQYAFAQAQAKKLSSPQDALQVLRDARTKPALKDSRRLRELQEKIYTDASEALLKSAKEQQATGSDEDKLKAVMALVDLQSLEELADIPKSKRQSNKEMGHLRSDLASVAESVIRSAQEFDPAAISLDQAIIQASSLSSRLQAFDSVLPMFSSELEVIKDRLTKRRRDVAKSLDNLKELQKKLGTAQDPLLWNQAMQTGDFQPLENYSRQIGRLGLAGMQEVQDFDKRLAEWKEIRSYLLREIDEIEKKFSPEEAFEDVNVRITRLKSLPKFRMDGQPWEKIYQRDYDAIRDLMNASLRVNDLYSAGELVGWQAVSEAATARQEELDHWLEWNKQCRLAMDDLVRAGETTKTHTLETPSRFRLRDWEKQQAAAQSAIDLLKGGMQVEGKKVEVQSGKGEAIQKANKENLAGAEEAWREAKRQIDIINSNVILFPTSEEFNDAIAQQDWNRLQSLLERAKAVGTIDPEELKRVAVHSKVLFEKKKELEKKKSIFDRLSGRG